MKHFLLAFAFMFLAGSVFCQGTEKHYIILETSQKYTHTNNSDTSWKEAIPYKHRVRIISEPFDFPKGFDSRWSSEAGVQFLEYLMTHYREEFSKMKMHQSYYSGVDWLYDPASNSSIQQYKAMSADPRSGDYMYEIILVKGFKYVPGKYPVVKNRGTTPLHEKALLLLTKGTD